MTEATTSAPIERLAYRMSEVAKALGIHISTVYRLVESGKLRAVKVGHRTLITKADLDDMLARGTKEVAA